MKRFISRLWKWLQFWKKEEKQHRSSLFPIPQHLNCRCCMTPLEKPKPFGTVTLTAKSIKIPLERDPHSIWGDFITEIIVDHMSVNMERNLLYGMPPLSLEQWAQMRGYYS